MFPTLKDNDPIWRATSNHILLSLQYQLAMNTSALHIGVHGLIPYQSLNISLLPTQMLGDLIMAQVIEFLLPMWKTQIEFPAPESGQGIAGRKKKNSRPTLCISLFLPLKKKSMLLIIILSTHFFPQIMYQIMFCFFFLNLYNSIR